MNTESLIRMANQIGAFFEAMPDRPEALEGIAQHLRRFWEPRMRREFLACIDSGAASGELSGVVAEAVRLHRDLLA
jgi:formate dehydrogenase subunit delta